MSLRILVLNWLDRENPLAGGAESHLDQVFGRLVERGHEVTLLASAFPGAAERAELDGIRVLRTGGRHTFNLAAPLYYRRFLAECSFDLVIEDLNKVPLFSPLWVRDPVVLLVHHLFGTTAFQEATLAVAGATWLLERPLSRVFDGIPTVAVSESTAADLVRRGLEPAQIEVIPNGVDAGRYTPGPERDRFPEPTILYLGRLKRYKRVDLVIRAVSRLRERSVPCHLLVAGRGEAGSRLRRLRDRLGLQEWVSFLGWVPEERKLELLRRCWLHVLTSAKEGWGISNLEAAACGTPSVVSDSPGLRDSVLDGETGRLVPHGNVERLADEIGRLLRDGEERRRLGAGARRFAEGHAWPEIAERWDRFLERFTGNPS